MDLLLSKGVVDNHSFHKVCPSFPKVVLNERISIVARIAIVDNTELVIQMGGHTPRVVFLDISAQLNILKVQFAKKLAMLDSKL